LLKKSKKTRLELTQSGFFTFDEVLFSARQFKTVSFVYWYESYDPLKRFCRVVRF
jgi:hypothetical protein